MLNSKTRLTLFTGLMMALVNLLLILAQRFIFPVYLQRIARETILHEADAFLKQTSSPPETRVSVQANSLVLLEDFSPGTVYHSVSYTHLRAHETVLDLVCRLLLEKKKQPECRHRTHIPSSASKQNALPSDT